MICYKDMTFCPGPCANVSCYRHTKRVEEGKDLLEKHPYLGVAWFIEMPSNCPDFKSPLKMEDIFSGENINI